MQNTEDDAAGGVHWWKTKSAAPPGVINLFRSVFIFAFSFCLYLEHNHIDWWSSWHTHSCMLGGSRSHSLPVKLYIEPTVMNLLSAAQKDCSKWCDDRVLRRLYSLPQDGSIFPFINAAGTKWPSLTPLRMFRLTSKTSRCFLICLEH